MAAYQLPVAEASQTHPVSVIVCSRDEDQNLARNLPGLLVQDYPTTHEVIVVNDNSVDDTRFILDELQKQYKKLQVIGLTQDAKLIAGKKFPLSIGIKECRHEIVLLTDADCVPASEHWISKMQAAFTPGIEVVLGYGAYYKRPGVLNKLIRWETFHTALQYFGFALAGTPYMGVGRNLSYRKELFFRNKGFSAINSLPGGDDDLFINKVAHKGNTAVVIHPDAFTLSQPKKTWKDWLRQKRRHYSTGKYYKPAHQFLLGLYAATLFLFYPLFIASLLLFDWRLALIPFVIKLLVQGAILKKAMKQLAEDDLWRWFPLLDIWMFVYYLIFADSLWKKPRNSW
ncbi:MAG TPA: glycosyltransferase, partial [Chitinophagaceae bacterium]|nr:glycosyltransferase [Chitinophagaceae bacterium]